MLRVTMTCALRFLLAGVLCLATHAHGQVVDGQTLVIASLVPDTTAIQPGRPFQVGLRLKMAPHWHTYWRYAGDAGLPTRIDWTLPEGFTAGPIQWPAPEQLVDPGDIVTYGYSEEVVLLTTITPPDSLDATDVTIGAVAKWLVCEEICVPGQADDLSVTLPVGQGERASDDLLEKFREQLPDVSAPFKMSWSQSPDAYHLRVTGNLPEGEWEYFPEPSGNLQISHPTLQQSGGELSVTVPIEAGTGGVLGGVIAVRSGDQRQAWEVPASDASVPVETAAAPPAPLVPAVGLTVPKALFFGMLGGLILNLMPCVLPVIALKIFGFMKQAGQSRQRARALGLVFVAGVFAWFLGLAVLITALRAAGRELNWAFQFQHPAFVLGMMVLLFVFALNLLGVFEVYLPGHVNESLSDVSGREGYAGTFLHGVLATLLATPCTAPFLGPALGFAFSQPAVVVFAIFAAIAFGMSLPYILLSLEPGWIRFLPKPGGWMERVKQAMGFLLLGTVIFLLWVVGRQRGVDGMALASVMLLMLGVAGWTVGEAGRSAGWARRVALVVALAFAGLAAQFFTRTVQASAPVPGEAGRDSGGGIAWEAYSPEALAEARNSGRPVFLDFTADWCVNCKWNERFVIETDEVRAAFEDRAVISMQADWTEGDPAITALLKSFGRAGVPLYVLYPPGPASQPLVLPEILTRDKLLEALKKIE